MVSWLLQDLHKLFHGSGEKSSDKAPYSVAVTLSTEHKRQRIILQRWLCMKFSYEAL